jgi:hypothetical protein
VTAYLPGFKHAIHLKELTYFLQAALNDQHKLSKQDDEDQPEPETHKTRKLVGTPGYCTYWVSMLNLFNTAAYAEQNSFFPTACQTAACGCDGDVILIDTGNPPPNYAYVKTKRVASDGAGTPSTPQYWKVTFS